MAEKFFLLITNNNTTWVVQYNPDDDSRAVYSLLAWIDGKGPETTGPEVGSWLESKGSAIELAFAIDAEKHSVEFDPDEALEYTELLDEIRMFG
ncbi:MAG: hypothetical protein GC154_04140 [bacterium]|nr:hypothetical protein [bacterium]